jgi:UDP-N-acetylglucosamine 1-carboxyvinyltransferase
MQKMVIEGGMPLKGKVKTSGAKNAALPAMAAALLSSGHTRLLNIPELADIRTFRKVLEGLGTEVKEERHALRLSTDSLRAFEAPYDLVKTMRASVLVLGPLVSRYGRARVSLPGGCAIGARPINLHLKALEAMGAEIELASGYVEACAKRLHGAKIYFDTVTVTGTENILMAAVLAKGTSVIENAAREPEVTDLANLLIQMGAKIHGVGTDRLEIEGVDSLEGTTYEIISDRIEAGTFMIAAALTGGEILVQGMDPQYLHALTIKLRETGAKVSHSEAGILVKGPSEIQSVNIQTNPYPGFATDFQAQWMTLMSVATDTSTIHETIFENRFMHASELCRLGADIRLDGSTAIVRGVKSLRGAPVMATDLRASASLVLAGLVAAGKTEIHRLYHIDRGYENIEKKLRKLGAKIKRVKS